MVSGRFIFIGKVFLIAFVLINFVNLLPINLNNLDYYIQFTTVLLDTATILVLGVAIPRFSYLNELNQFDKFKNLSNDNNQLQSIQLKIFYNKRFSYFLAIFFFIITISQPLLLILNMNKSDIISTGYIQSLQDNFDKQEKNIIDLIKKEENTEGNEEKIKMLRNRINYFSDLKNSTESQFIETHNMSQFNISKISVRNLLLGLLWTLAFYKLFKI